jgi:hypothetical protein
MWQWLGEQHHTLADQKSKLTQMQLYAPEPNFKMILTTISTGSLLYMYPASASYFTPQNNQHVPYAYYLNHSTPITPSNPTSYYPDTLTGSSKYSSRIHSQYTSVSVFRHSSMRTEAETLQFLRQQALTK